MIRFEKAFLIQIDYSNLARFRMISIYSSSRYRRSPVPQIRNYSKHKQCLIMPVLTQECYIKSN